MADLFVTTTQERAGSDAGPLVVVALKGPPEGKGRPRGRIVKPHGKQPFISFYTPAETRDYEARLEASGVKRMAGRAPFEGPLAVVVWCFMPIPESWSQKKKTSAIDGVIFPIGKPDWENVAKMLDGLNKIVWVDDSQIVDGRVVMLYSEVPALVVEVHRMDMARLPVYCAG